MRVLHLIDDASPQATATTLAMVGDAWGRLGHIEQKLVLLGGASLGEAAESVGLRDADLLGVPFGRAWLSWPALRCRLKNLGRFDLIHCWSIGALSVASIFMRATPRLLTLTLSPSKRSVNWLRVLASDTAGRTVILPISNTIRRDLVSGGVAEDAVVVLRPGIDMGRIDLSARSERRRAWGIGDSIRAVALLCDPNTAGDAIEGVMTVGLAAETLEDQDAGIRLIVHPNQFRRRRAELIVQQAKRPYGIIQEPLTTRPWEVLPGCDVVLAHGPRAGGLSLLWGMAANVAIVSEATYAISEVLEDRHSALLAMPGQRNALANRIERILKNKHLAWQLRDTARHEAYSFFSRQRYCQSIGGIYEQMVDGRDVQVPPMEVTGGLRFSGRA